MWADTVQPVVITLLVVLEVAVWQVRVALATRGRKQIAAMLGAVNAVLSILAVGQVVTHLDRPANIAGYAVGVALGVYLGVVADARFAGDPVEYRVVVNGDGGTLAQELRSHSWPVTVQPAVGLRGPAAVLSVVVDASRITEIERHLDALAPDGLRTSIRLRSATWASLPPGFTVMSTGARLLRRPRTTDARPHDRVNAQS